MIKQRLHIILSEDAARLLEGACLQTGATKTKLVDAAIKELLDKKSDDRELAKLVARLDKMSNNLDRLAGDAAAQTETLALYILYYLCITPPLPESTRGSCEALGAQRFEHFIGQVGDRLMGKDRFADALLEKMGLEHVDLEHTDHERVDEPRVMEAVQ